MIKQEIEKIVPYDALEQEHLDDVKAWLDTGVEVCRIKKPSTPPKHLVSYFVIVDCDHVLLVDHKNANLWLPSGGHVEPGEHPKDTVVREAQEELQISADFISDYPVFITCTETVGLTAGHTDVSLWYVLRGNREGQIEYDKEEFYGIKWFQFDQIPFEKSDPHMSRFIKKWYSSTVRWRCVKTYAI